MFECVAVLKRCLLRYPLSLFLLSPVSVSSHDLRVLSSFPLFVTVPLSVPVSMSSVSFYNSRLSVYHNLRRQFFSPSPSSSTSHPGLVSVLGNGSIMIMFCRRLRHLTAAEVLLLNLAVMHLCLAVFSYPAPTISNFAHRWLFGNVGECVCREGGQEG